MLLMGKVHTMFISGMQAIDQMKKELQFHQGTSYQPCGIHCGSGYPYYAEIWVDGKGATYWLLESSEKGDVVVPFLYFDYRSGAWVAYYDLETLATEVMTCRMGNKVFHSSRKFEQFKATQDHMLGKIQVTGASKSGEVGWLHVTMGESPSHNEVFINRQVLDFMEFDQETLKIIHSSLSKEKVL